MTYNEALRLTEDRWHTLDDTQKVEVLQTIENHVAQECGRSPCSVEDKFLYTGSDGIVLGQYDRHNEVIYINSSQFDSESLYGKDSSKLIKCCLHEGRHAYQNQVVSGKIESDDKQLADAWRYNLKDGNYISFKENPRAYYEQPVEVDARNFAETRYQTLTEERLQCNRNENNYVEAKEIFEKQMSYDNSVETQKVASFSEEQKTGTTDSMLEIKNSSGF